MNLKEALDEKYIVRIKPSEDLVKEEFEEAKYDLEKSEASFEEGDYKWSAVKSYYSMFHAARAVLFKKGFREKRHFAVVVVLEDLAFKGLLEYKYVDDFEAALEVRKDADYRNTYSRDNAAYILDIAKEFLERMKKLVKVIR